MRTCPSFALLGLNMNNGSNVTSLSIISLTFLPSSCVVPRHLGKEVSQIDTARFSFSSPRSAPPDELLPIPSAWDRRQTAVVLTPKSSSKIALTQNAHTIPNRR